MGGLCHKEWAMCVCAACVIADLANKAGDRRKPKLRDHNIVAHLGGAER